MRKSQHGELTARIKKALARASCLEPRDIEVRVEHGWVHLEGTVPASWDKERVELLVKALPEVGGVTNKLDVVSTSSR